jgi:hypothetical protein
VTTLFSYPSDIIRISRHLGYDPTEPTYIVSKMRRLESLDTTWANNPSVGSMEYVGMALSILDSLDELEQIKLGDIQDESSEVKKRDSYLEGSIEYFDSNHKYSRYSQELNYLGRLSKLLGLPVKTQAMTSRRYKHAQLSQYSSQVYLP